MTSDDFNFIRAQVESSLEQAEANVKRLEQALEQEKIKQMAYHRTLRQMLAKATHRN
jgi:hypothetical protein